MDYLQYLIGEEDDYSNSYHSMNKALNTVLITNTQLKYGQEWYRHDDDGYFYQNIVDHALQASAFQIVEQLTTDIRWINAKAKACKTVWGLLFDLQAIYQQVHVQVS